MTDPPPLSRHVYHNTQAAADALVAEAADDDRFRPLPGLPARNNAVRLMVGCWFASGSVAYPRGWVRAVMLACREAGAPHPNHKCLRWYRSRLRECPSYFAGTRGVPDELLAQMEQDVDVG